MTKIQQVFEWFLELLTNTTREVVSPAMRAAAEDMCGPGDADRIFTADTRELMGFFITMRRLLVECGIKDFTFADVYRPTHPRLVKIFSYIINFIRFRESQTTVIDEHYNSSERVKNMMEQLYHSNQEKDDQLREMEQNRKNVEMAIKDKEKRELELKTRLLELSKSQKRVMDKLTEVQDESNRLKGLLEEKTATVLNVRQEANKLRPYTEQSPAALEQALRALSTNLSSDRIEIERLEKRSRALQTSSDSFTLLQTDISSLTRLLLDLKAELAKEDEEARSATQNRDALSTQSNSVREVEREEKRLSKQLDRWLSNTENVRRDADTRAANAKQKMERLRAVHRELTAERRDRGEEVERRRVRIEQTEKKVSTSLTPLVIEISHVPNANT